MLKNRIKIPSRLYYKSFSEKWLNSLAIYVYLCKSHSGKNYYFKPNQKTKMIKALADAHKISLTSLQYHLSVLENNGLLTVYPTEIRLTKNIDLFRLNSKSVFVPANINSLKEIKTFLKTIPILSNLVSQEKAVKKIQRLNYIREQSEKRCGKIKVAELKRLSRYNNKGGKMVFNEQFQLSVRSMGNLIERKDKNTIGKYKKFLKDSKIINVFNEKIKLFKHRLSFCIFTELRMNNIIDLKTYFYKGFIYQCMPSNIQLAYRGVNAL